MAVPKGKISKARRDKRRNSHWSSLCPAWLSAEVRRDEAGAQNVQACGYYNGREVKSVKEA